MWRFYRYKSYLNQSMQGLAGGNGNFEDYWQQSSFSYKCCCLSSSIMFALSLLIPGLIILCIDIPNLTIWSFELWRLFVSMYGQIPTVMSILSILFSFMWIYSILKVHRSLFRIQNTPLSTKYSNYSSLTWKFI